MANGQREVLAGEQDLGQRRSALRLDARTRPWPFRLVGNQDLPLFANGDQALSLLREAVGQQPLRIDLRRRELGLGPWRERIDRRSDHQRGDEQCRPAREHRRLLPLSNWRRRLMVIVHSISPPLAARTRSRAGLRLMV
jgi:hypothetical protein